MNSPSSRSLSASSILFFRYQVSVQKSLPMVREWLQNNPTESDTSLGQLIQSGKVIVKENKLYSLSNLSFEEACQLGQEIQRHPELEIKDRRYHLKQYRQCFIGSELVEWLIKNKGIGVQEAISLGQSLIDHQLIAHVCNDHNFKNDFLFYRFIESS